MCRGLVRSEGVYGVWFFSLNKGLQQTGRELAWPRPPCRHQKGLDPGQTARPPAPGPQWFLGTECARDGKPGRRRARAGSGSRRGTARTGGRLLPRWESLGTAPCLAGQSLGALLGGGGIEVAPARPAREGSGRSPVTFAGVGAPPALVLGSCWAPPATQDPGQALKSPSQDRWSFILYNEARAGPQQAQGPRAQWSDVAVWPPGDCSVGLGAGAEPGQQNRGWGLSGC